MIAPLGHSVILAALVLALVGSGASFTAGRMGSAVLLAWGRRAAFAVLALVAAAVGLMLVALITHDFSVKYVADVGSRETPLYYTIISLWAALEGSILFWAFLLAAYTTVFLLIYRNRFAELQPYITAVLLAVSGFFLFVIAGPGNPFQTVSPAPADGPGPNALLQNHPMMGLHPPLLYLGYVGLSIPFAIAVASLLVGAPGPSVLQLIRRWALIPWVFLSLGIIAGMWWSYAVLGWGGYWSWDPVENASVMPWLVTTAFLHSLQVQERRQMLKAWTMSLIMAAFLLSLLGTFLTRSGVLESVHSFTQSAIGPVFLGFLAVVLVSSLGLLFARSRELGAPGSLDAAVCRETAFLFNNLLLVAITFTILLGTVFPLLAEIVQGSQLSVGAPYFNHVAVPIGFTLLFLMGVGPALPWGAARMEDLQYRLLLPVVVGVGTILILLALGVRGVGALVTFGAAAFVLTVTLERVVADIRTRRVNTAEGWPAATRRLMRANPRRYGGYLVHIGVLLVLIGIAASQSYQERGSATLRPGQSISVDGYTLTYRGLRPSQESNRMILAAEVGATRAGENLGSFRPSQNFYTAQQLTVVTPAVREEPWGLATGLFAGRNPLPDLSQLLHGRNPFEDLYLVLEAVDARNANQHPQRVPGASPRPAEANRSITLLVLINPMVGFIWFGGLVVGLGGVLSLLPVRRRQRTTVSSVEVEGVINRQLLPEEVTA
jgi:cytochrome c-type biogenesis protein CcmF